MYTIITDSMRCDQGQSYSGSMNNCLTLSRVHIHITPRNTTINRVFGTSSLIVVYSATYTQLTQ
jgi:hypothetical protein